MVGRTLTTTLLLLSVALPTAVAGQQVWPASLEVSIGRTGGSTSGEYRSSDHGLALDVLAGVGVRELLQGRLVVAAGLAMQGAGSSLDICLPSSAGGCIPRFPEFTIASAMAGWETKNGVARVVAGPAYLWADHSAFGWQAQGSLFLVRAWRLTLGLVLRGALLPNYKGDSFQLVAGGMTLRVR